MKNSEKFFNTSSFHPKKIQFIPRIFTEKKKSQNNSRVFTHLPRHKHLSLLDS